MPIGFRRHVNIHEIPGAARLVKHHAWRARREGFPGLPGSPRLRAVAGKLAPADQRHAHKHLRAKSIHGLENDRRHRITAKIPIRGRSKKGKAFRGIKSEFSKKIIPRRTIFRPIAVVMRHTNAHDSLGRHIAVTHGLVADAARIHHEPVGNNGKQCL